MSLCRCLVVFLALLGPLDAQADELPGRAQVESALRRAVSFFRESVAVEGGYVWRVGVDLKLREGEGEAGTSRVWVQPPGTPTIGEAFLDAYEATGDRYHLDGAFEVARCLERGQLHSGGWDYFIEFDPAQRALFGYRDNPEPPRKLQSRTTLDDDTTQSALRFLLRLIDLAPEGYPGKESARETVGYGMKALLNAQHPNGGWYVWWQEYPRERPSAAQYPVKPASFPETWDRTWKKDFPGRYVTNDGLMEDMIDLLLLGHGQLGEAEFLDAARRAGDFLILAQMPSPQPAWAQQYNVAMQPAWARKFEPPAISGGESQGILEALIKLSEATGDAKYLEPIPRALTYLRSSALPDGRLARFYELETNRPLYFNRNYELTYEPDDLPTHYAFIVGSRLDGIEEAYRRAIGRIESGMKLSARVRARRLPEPPSAARVAEVSSILRALDERGAWAEPGNMRGFNKARPPGGILSSETFARHVRSLCAYLGHRLPGDPESEPRGERKP